MDSTFSGRLVLGCILLLSLGAGIWDWKVRRIPNWLCLSGAVAGFLLNDFRFAIAGFGLALAIHLPLYALRAIGGGDVKLMAALGALLGYQAWLKVFIINALLGGVVAIAVVVIRGLGVETFKRIWFVMKSLGRGQAPYQANAELDVTSGLGRSLPRGVIIAVAVAIWAVWFRG